MDLMSSNELGKSSIVSRFLKRCLDIIGGIVGCVLALVALVFIKIAYLRDGDHESVIFTQERIGKDGKFIKIYKFRSMIPDAEEVLERLMYENEDIRQEYLTNKKLQNDPRVTHVGDMIRRTSLDEFPQFFNVLKGEMSLVGPRPYLPREIEDMGDAYNYIIKCKPGVTGPWQIGGRSDVTFETRLQMDIDYYNNHGFLSDIKILIETVTSVFLKKGAR